MNEAKARAGSKRMPSLQCLTEQRRSVCKGAPIDERALPFGKLWWRSR